MIDDFVLGIFLSVPFLMIGTFIVAVVIGTKRDRHRTRDNPLNMLERINRLRKKSAFAYSAEYCRLCDQAYNLYFEFADRAGRSGLKLWYTKTPHKEIWEVGERIAYLTKRHEFYEQAHTPAYGEEKEQLLKAALKAVSALNELLLDQVTEVGGRRELALYDTAPVKEGDLKAEGFAELTARLSDLSAGLSAETQDNIRAALQAGNELCAHATPSQLRVAVRDLKMLERVIVTFYQQSAEQQQAGAEELKAFSYRISESVTRELRAFQQSAQLSFQSDLSSYSRFLTLRGAVRAAS